MSWLRSGLHFRGRDTGRGGPCGPSPERQPGPEPVLVAHVNSCRLAARERRPGCAPGRTYSSPDGRGRSCDPLGRATERKGTSRRQLRGRSADMLRRIDNQGDLGQTFYLYRVRLRPDLAVRAGCSGEVVDFVGDVALRDVCPAGIDAARYVNSHEDPGGISLALGRDAVHSVQRLRLPLDNSSRASWRESALDRLTAASSQPVAVVEPDNELTRLRRRFNGGPTMTSRRMQGQTRILHEVTAHLPATVRRQVRAAVSIDDTADPAEWCDSLASVMQLIDDPEVVVLAARETTSTPVRDR